MAIVCYKKFVTLLTLLLSVVLNAFSQDYSYINYDTRDGLAGSVVYDVIQDKEGFMWFATENGLSRFDGKNFETFTTKDGLPDNEVVKLFLDSKGRVWIMPFKPSLCYYFKGKIYNRNNDSLLGKISLLAYAFEMTEDRSGNLFVAEEQRFHVLFRNGVVQMIDKIKGVPFYQFALGLNSHQEAELLTLRYLGAGWTDPAFSIFSPLANRLTMVKGKQNWPEISKSQITPDYLLVSKKIPSRLTFYKDTSQVYSTEIPTNTVSVNYINKSETVINTTAGIRFCDPQARRLSESIFKNFSVSSAYQDKENNLWLTTAGSGVLMVPSFQIKTFSFAQNKKFAEITALYQHGDTVYAGGWDNNVWRINTNNFTHSRIPTAFHNGKLISIIAVNNKLYFASSSSSRNPFNHNLTNLSQITVKSANVGKSGVVVAAHNTVWLCRPSGKEEKIWYGRSTCALEGDSGIYIGSLNGLFHKSYSGNLVYIGETVPALGSRIVNLALGADGILWVTTKGNGIAGLAHNKLLYHFTEKDGLTSDNCTSLCVDGNNVWVGTDKGLNRIVISTKNSIIHFSTSDGLPSNTINAIAVSRNKVFVGTPNGLTYFEVEKISQTSTCDLQFTGIYVSDKYWCFDSTNFSLPHKNNDIRFEYSGISFKSAGELTYKYRLVGLQPEWRTTNENQLSFPSLSSGNYTLQLVAINKYGVQSQAKEISFVIEKLLWQKPWFKIAATLLIAGGIWLLVAYRIRLIRAKEKENTKMNSHIAELEQKALRSQMNPHFIFNCLNSIQQYVAERDITGANNFITDFSRLIRMTLDLSTHPLISLSDEVEYISTYLKVERTRLESVFDYRVRVDESLDLRQVQMPPLLLQPYLENSIRHGVRYKSGGDGLIQISITKKNDGVLIQIEDNGIGRQASKKYKSEHHIQYQSRGMTINEDRVKILNNTAEKRIELMVTDLYNSKEEAAGTRVDVYLPS